DREQGIEAPERHAPQRDGVQAAGEAGQGAGEGEGGQLRSHRADGVRGRASLVVAHGDHGPTDAAAPEVAGEGEGDEQGPDAEEIEGERVVEVEALEHYWALEVEGVERREVAGVEQEGRYRHREREGGDGEEQALDAEGG